MTSRSPQTHDLTNRFWGHDYTFQSSNQGLEGTMNVWYSMAPLELGDFLLLQDGKGGTTRYRITALSRYQDPKDMYSLGVAFAPRSEEEWKRDQVMEQRRRFWYGDE